MKENSKIVKITKQKNICIHSVCLFHQLINVCSFFSSSNASQVVTHGGNATRGCIASCAAKCLNFTFLKLRKQARRGHDASGLCFCVYRSCDVHVCQIWVMTEFETITLTQDGAVDFKTIAVFLFPKFHRQPFFFAIEILCKV